MSPLPGSEPGSADSGSGGHGRLLRAAGTVGGLTLVSRVLGLIRDVALSALLGAGLVADAWNAAFLVPNALRRIVGEGNISASFIPVFVRQSRSRSEASSWALATRFYSAVLMVSATISVVGIVVAPWVVGWMFDGFETIPGKLELTVALTRAVFGYLLFISLSAVLMGVLNARDRFAAAAFTPVLLNLAIIAAVVTVRGQLPATAVWAIAAGAMVGGFLQFAFLVPFARRAGMSLVPTWPLGDPALAEIGRLMVPGIVGAGVVQINIVVGRKLASVLPEGSITSLYYASRLNELTLGVFAVAVATVVLPLMSRQGANDDERGLRTTLQFALRQVSVVTVPAAAGLILLRYEIVATLFEHGRFGADATTLTAAAVWGYAAGLAAVAGVRIVVQAFYALGDTRTPVMVAAGAMVLNVIGCVVLREPLANAGIALANSAAAVFSLVTLLFLLRRRVGLLGGRALAASGGRILFATALMAWVVDSLRGMFPGPAASVVANGVALAGIVGVGVLTYLAALAMLRAPELAELRAIGTRTLPVTLAGSGNNGGDG